MALTRKEIQDIIKDLKDQISALIGQGDYKMADKLKKEIQEYEKQLRQTKDSMEILELSGFTTDAINYSDEQLFRASWATWEYIVNNPSKYTPETVSTAQKLLNTKKRFLQKTGLKAYGGYGNKDEDPDTKYKNFMAGRKKPLTYSEGKKLLEEAKKAGIHPDYLKGMERGLSSLSKDEEVSSKFKKVMEEFSKGELKSSSGEKVTDPKQAKAIAYSESKDAGPISYLNKQVWVKHEANGQVYKGIINKESGNMVHVVLPSTGQSAWKAKNQVELVKDGTSLQPEIDRRRQKIKNLYDKAGDALNEKNKEKYDTIMSQIKVEEKNLNGLIRASMNDSCGEKIYTKGTEDGGPGSGIKGHTTSRSGYKMEDPKEIEAAIKQVKASGHPNPQYLAALERALEVAKQERGMKDSAIQKECNEILKLSGFIS